MPPLVRVFVKRVYTAGITFLMVTIVLFAGLSLVPPEDRAELFMPNSNRVLTETQRHTQIENIIETHHLRDPVAVQYFRWMKELLTGSWGYSPVLGEAVFPSLLRRTPVTLELAIYSVFLLVPLGFAAGLVAGWAPNRPFDRAFRALAFIVTSIPPFIFSIIMMSIFYVALGWFFPGRLDTLTAIEVSSPAFRSITGLLTIDSLLNGRMDIFLTAWRHLAMPLFALSLYQWATLGRITRALLITEKSREYLVAARARGVSSRQLLWKHAARAILAPSMTSIGLAAASIVTGIFVVEIIFNLNGVSEVIVLAMRDVPDIAATMGFSIYSVVMVLGLMLGVDIFQAVLDPRMREEMLQP